MCQVGRFLMISLLTELTTESQGKQYISIIFYSFIIHLSGCVGPSSWAFSACGGGATPCRGAWPLTAAALLLRSSGALEQQGRRMRGSVAALHRLSCSEACGVFLDQRPMSPTLRGGFLSTTSPGKSQSCNTRLCSPEKV